MKKRTGFLIAGVFFAAFALWTLLVSLVDVEAIGPRGSEVGFATLNGAVHRLVGVNMTLYTVTDWLGLVPIGVAFCFGVMGLIQWIKRRRFTRVDFDILTLGGFYLLVIGFYVTFEFVVINRRPVLIEGYLEASYPSSTTVLVMCVMITMEMVLKKRIRRRGVRLCVSAVIYAFVAFMVVGRLISGVHWLSDIVGGALFSVGAVILYYSVNKTSSKFQNNISKF